MIQQCDSEHKVQGNPLCLYESEDFIWGTKYKPGTLQFMKKDGKTEETAKENGYV